MNMDIAAERRTLAAEINSKLGDVRDLYDLAAEKTPESRVQLTHAICHMLEHRMSERETEILADVLIELIRQAEHDVRQAVAMHLAPMYNVPSRLILELANDEIDIAGSVLQVSPVLCEYDLMFIIKSKPAEYWREIAKRSDLVDPLIDELANAGDFETALSLAKNDAITLTERALVILAELAADSDLMAAPLVRRHDVPVDLVRTLYKVVGQEVKKYIAHAYDGDQEIHDNVYSAVDAAVEELSADRDQDHHPAEFMVQAAKSFKQEGKLSVHLMMQTLRRGQIKSFIAQFAVFTDLSALTMEQILSQRSGQALAIVCKACGVEKGDFLSIYMLSARLWNDFHMIEPHDISKATRYFDKITFEFACDIMRDKNLFNPNEQ